MNPIYPTLHSHLIYSQILAFLILVGLLLSASSRAAITFYDSHESWLAAATNTYYPSHVSSGPAPSAADRTETLVIQDAIVTGNDPYQDIHNQGFITIAHNYLSDGISTASDSNQTIVIGDEPRNGITVFAYLGSFAWNRSFLHAFGMWVQPTSPEWRAAPHNRLPHSAVPDPGNIVGDDSYKPLTTGFVGWIADDNDVFRGIDIINSSYDSAAAQLTISRIDYYATTVPEPGSILLLCGSISAFIFVRKRSLPSGS